MKYSAPASLAFAVGASAASVRPNTCSFTLTASGGESGKVGQLSDGQLRILGGHPTATFTISNGTTVDSQGRPCYLTSQANQYQCDTGMTATGGFAIGTNGSYSHSGSTVFYACPSSDSDYNIYTTPVAGQSKCVEVGLTASGCFAPASSSSSSTHASTSTSPAKTSVVSATTSHLQTCAPSTVTVSSPAQTVYVTSSAVSTAPGHTVYETKTLEATAPAQTVVVTQTPSAQTIYQTKTLEETAPVQTVVVTHTPSAQTVYQTTTVKESAPVHTVQVTETTPGHTVHETQTRDETAPAQTVYVTQTQQNTVAPSTITVTQAAAPSTVTITQIQTMTAVSTEQHTATESVKVSSAPVTTSQVQVTTSAVSTPNASSASSFISSAISKASSVSFKASSTASSSHSCPTNLNGTYSSPNLIVPVSSASPDKSYGTSYDGVVNSTVSTLFNFDIPSSYASKTCSLVFLFPTQDMLETSSYTFSGSGAIDFKQLSTTVTTSSTYNSMGSTKTDFGSKTCTPGSWTVVDTFACPAAKAISFEMSAGGSNTNLWWFEDYNPSPIGLFITTC
ncbi:hypothetical protein MFRU_003g02300 [Monilinia fructicola]|uniref:Uncharacterized protein n=1 Tax=Monilinia fructicola TaxID=38448 RepID=A0A5M9JTR0_MONFR|nr:hypothetical protein EYC84_003183 [Monilinia fructicola]KAG4034257.1 hypothetical protein MFRU_003g02300 [Monilinia fructicola]